MYKLDVGFEGFGFKIPVSIDYNVLSILAPTQLTLCEPHVMSVVGRHMLRCVERLLEDVQTKTFPQSKPSLESIRDELWVKPGVYLCTTQVWVTNFSVHLCVLSFVCLFQPAPSDLHVVHVCKCFWNVRVTQVTQSRKLLCFATQFISEDKPIVPHTHTHTKAI